MANGLLPMVCGGAAGCPRSREGSRGSGGLPSVVGCQWPMANGTWGSHVVNDGRWLGVRACVRVCVRVRVHYPCARACAQPNAKGIANIQWVERPMANGRHPACTRRPQPNGQWPMANGHGSQPQWPIANGQWPMANGQGPQPHWPMSPMANGQWAMACALWLVIQWGVECNGACGCSRCLQAARGGSWPMTNGHGPQPQWPMANGQWQMANGHRSWALARGHFLKIGPRWRCGWVAAWLPRGPGPDPWGQPGCFFDFFLTRGIPGVEPPTSGRLSRALPVAPWV